MMLHLHELPHREQLSLVLRVQVAALVALAKKQLLAAASTVLFLPQRTPTEPGAIINNLDSFELTLCISVASALSEILSESGGQLSCLQTK